VTRFIELTVQGLAIGAVYALIAVGWVIIYRATEVLSFAQPGLMIFGTYFTIYFSTVVGLGFFAALGIAIVLTAILGGVLERIAMRPMVGKEVFAAVMVTIGLDVILRTNVNALLGPQPRQVGDPWGRNYERFAGIGMFESDIATLLAAAMIVALTFVFLKRSRFGLAMQATAFDQEAARAQGIPVGRMFNLSWVIAGGLAAGAGAFLGAGGTTITQGTWIIALRALPAMVIGGLDSIQGALVGGAIVGLVQVLTAAYQPTYAPWLGANFQSVSPYVVMLIVLMFRPYGLWGTPEVERV
jgi:branched-chain amino acid transport system permease protein